MRTVRDRIIQSVAEAAGERAAAGVVEHLQQQPATLSGDDSGLATVWDEFCVQVQEEESFFWEAYTDTAAQLIEAELQKLPRHELEAIWLQTDAGWDWLYDLEAEDGHRGNVTIPYDICEAAKHVLHRYLMPLAEDFSNAEIDAYLESGQMARHELDSEPGAE